MSFRELAEHAAYPRARELVVRELCRAIWGQAGAEELCLGAREALRYARSLVSRVATDRDARGLALDAGCVADELLAMAAAVRAGVGRG